MNPLQKTYTELVSFLAVWFNNLKTHTYKVQVTNDKDDKALQAKLQEVVNAVNKLTNSGLSAEVTVDNTPLIKAVNGLRMSLMGTQKVEVTNQKLPKLELPKLLKTEVTNFPDKQEVTGTIDINNFKDLIDGLQVVVDSINDLDLNFKNELKNVGSNIVASSMGSRAALKLWDGTNEVGVTNNALDVNASIDPAGLATEAKQDSMITAIENIAAGGDATAANQVTMIGHVDGIETLIGTSNSSLATIAGDTTSIDAKIPALGQALAANSVPVILPSATITTLTPQTDALTDTQLRATPVPVSGTVTANLSATDNAVLDTIDAVLDAINAKLVTGTVIGDVNLGATDNAVLDDIAAKLATIDADTSTLAAGVSTEYQVDVVAALPAGTNAIGKLAANSGVDIGDVDVTSIAAGSNLIGNVGIGVRTSGGATPFYNLDVDETEDAIKASAGQLYELYCNNTTAAQIFVKLYNATTANVTVGTTTPVMTIPVPGNADSDGAGVVRQWPMGLAFGTAITIAATTGAADNDTGAPGAGAIIVSGAYN